MPARSHEEWVAILRTRFDNGEERAALESLLVRVRRDPTVTVYRDALSDFYRRAGHPDQAARWGAHDPTSLSEVESRALRRTLSHFRTEEQVRKYLALPGGLPPETTAHLAPRSMQRMIRLEPAARSLQAGAAIGGTLLGGGTAALGGVTVVVLAFTGDPGAQSAAQIFASMALILIALCGAMFVVAELLLGRWVRSGVLAAAVVLAAIALAHADMTSPLPFG